MNDFYSPIKHLTQSFINHTKQSRNFDFISFYRQMENLFADKNFREEINSGVENILIMRLDAIGDFVLSTGFIRELRLNYPSARITLVVSKLVYPIAELCPYVNRVLMFDNDPRDDILTMFEKVSSFVFDNLIDDHFSKSISIQWGSENLSALMMGYMSGARERIGYGYQIELMHLNQLPPKDQDMNYLLLTQPIFNPKELIHEADHHYYIFKAMGLPVRSTKMELWFSHEDFLNARRLLNSIPIDSFKIIIGIGAGGTNRKYPIELYSKAFKEILNRNPKIIFIIVGGQSEFDDAKLLQNNLPSNSVINLANKTSLRETIAVISQANMYIGNVTGIMHMAATLQIPLITIYRQPKDKDHILTPIFSEYDRFAPYQATSIVLRPSYALDDCKDFPVYGGCKNLQPHCITQVKPDEIVEAFNHLYYYLNHTHLKSLHK